MLQFGFLAVVGEDANYWTIFIGSVLAFAIQVYAMQRRGDRTAAGR